MEPTPPPPAAPATPPLALVAMRPVVGVSAEYALILTRELNDRSKTRSIALMADPNATAETTLVGYFNVKKPKKVKDPTIVDYNWDVLDPKGGLRNRVAGSEAVALKSPKDDIWSAMPPAATARIADKAYEALGADLPKSNITTSSIDKVERKAEKP